MSLIDKNEILSLLVDDVVEIDTVQLSVREKYSFSSLMKKLYLFRLENNMSLLYDELSEKYYILKDENIDIEALPRKFQYNEVSFKRNFKDFLAVTIEKSGENAEHSKSKVAIYNSKDNKMIFYFQINGVDRTFLALPANTEALTIYGTGEISS